MSLPPGTKKYQVDTTGVEFYWSSHDRCWVFLPGGARVRNEDLNSYCAAVRAHVQQGGSAASATTPRSLPPQPSITTSGQPGSSYATSSNYVTGSASRPSGSVLPSTHYGQGNSPWPQGYQSGPQPAAQRGAPQTGTGAYYGTAPQSSYASAQPSYSQTGAYGGQATLQGSNRRESVSSYGGASQGSVAGTQQYGARASSRQQSAVPSSAQNQAGSYSNSSAPSYSVNYGTQPVRPNLYQAHGGSSSTGATLTTAFGNLTLNPSSQFTDQRRSTGRDDRTGIAYDNQYGPPEAITDPSLRRTYGVSARAKIYGTPGDSETFDESYRVRKQPRKFFVRGKVFKIFWSEPAGESSDSVTEITRDARFNQSIHSKVRRFVVIKEGDSHCSALPIMTYGNRGTSKRGVKKSDFAIIYTGKQPPSPTADEQPRQGEAPMRPAALRVDPDERGAKLLSNSRLNFAKVYTVEHNVKVKSFGMVNRDSERDLMYQFRAVWEELFGPQLSAPPVQAAGPSTALANADSVRTRTSAPSNTQYTTREALRAAMQGGTQSSAAYQRSQSRSTQSKKSHPSHSGRSGHSARRPPSDDEDDEDDEDEDEDEDDDEEEEDDSESDR